MIIIIIIPFTVKLHTYIHSSFFFYLFIVISFVYEKMNEI